jgi:aminoglycoside/choline kinase family phosphotransferase
MDAPPQHEPLDAFLKVDLLLENAGLNVPKIIERNIDDGFLLLNDLGNKTYLAELNNETADWLYKDATHALVQMQLASKPDVLPNYDEALLQRELNLFPEWYLHKHLHIQLNEVQTSQINQAFKLIIHNNLAQAKVYVHRDYHSRNLMVTEKNNPGVIDFQDAVCGPITYDAASLWRDAYIAWPEERVIDWVIKFWETGRQCQMILASSIVTLSGWAYRGISKSWVFLPDYFIAMAKRITSRIFLWYWNTLLLQPIDILN